MGNPKVLIVATSRKTRGGITSVIKAHETGEQWKKYHCRWIETHRDGGSLRKLWYFFTGTVLFFLFAPFYDIIHMHVSFAGSLDRKCFYMRICKLLHKKTMVHFHPPGPEVLMDVENQPKYRYLFGSADKVIVLSNQWVKWIEEFIYCKPINEDKKGRLNFDNLKVLYNPCLAVDEKLLVPIKDRGKYILFAGALIVRKGYKGLIRGFARIADKHPDWKVVLAGVDEEHEAEGVIKELGVEKQVELEGWCENDKIRDLYRNAGVYCLASSGEGFPMVVLEAWAYGTPVVCTPVGGLPDILDEGVNALSFDYDDDARLAEQLDKLICDEHLREKMSVEGLRLAKDVFNIQVINKQLEKIYEEL